jgi:RNA polymerase sigma-70 factor (ECF subfamily)
MQNMPADNELERLYDAHAQALFAFLLSFTRNEADTRDVLQEVFIKLARQPAMLDDVRDERAFLARLAHNAAIDMMRRRGTRQRNYDQLAAESLQLFEPAASPDEQAFRDALTAALGELPPDQRTVAHLKLWEGLTFEEIAARLGIPPNTAASRYRYAIDKLRDRLRPIYEELK